MDPHAYKQQARAKYDHARTENAGLDFGDRVRLRAPADGKEHKGEIFDIHLVEKDGELLTQGFKVRWDGGTVTDVDLGAVEPAPETGEATGPDS
jgi:hypothetical protein